MYRRSDPLNNITAGHDIALLELKQPVNFSPTVIIILLILSPNSELTLCTILDKCTILHKRSVEKFYTNADSGISDKYEVYPRPWSF